uniref:Uncharacterized protein n=1 Tax=Aegilops tauschii subsp. strangulata TaxID=200361 RepID=A0A453QFN5_AEGTS
MHVHKAHDKIISNIFPPNLDMVAHQNFHGRRLRSAELHSILSWTPSQRRSRDLVMVDAIAAPNSTSPSWRRPRHPSSGHHTVLPQHHAATFVGFTPTYHDDDDITPPPSRHHTDSPSDDGIAPPSSPLNGIAPLSSCGSLALPSSSSGTAWPPSCFSRCRRPSRMESVAPQPTPSQRRSPWTILSWMTSSRCRPPHHHHLAASHRNGSPAASCHRQPPPRADVLHLTWSSPRRRRRSLHHCHDGHHSRRDCRHRNGGSDTWRRLSLQRRFFFLMAVSPSSTFSLCFSQTHKNTLTVGRLNTYTRTRQGRKRTSFAKSSPPW